MMDGALSLPLPVALPPAALDQLMPMHLALSAEGWITGAGPTLAKLFPGQPLIGRRFADLFDLRQPAGIADMAGLATCGRLRLTPKGRSEDGLRGIAVPLAGGGVLLNLSFGRGVIDAVRRHALTVADFAPTDLTLELLFLAEAKAAIMEELTGLTLRLKGARDAAQEEALTDTLTGLRNRRAADAALAVLLAGQRPFGLMHMDLDYFKAVNDTLGHAAGDHVLRSVADSLRSQTRSQDIVARVGGDEFLIIFPDLAEAETLLSVAARIIAQIARPVLFEGQPCRIAASIGVALSGGHPGTRADLLMQRVDAALYAAKHAGRGRAMLAADPKGDPPEDPG